MKRSFPMRSIEFFTYLLPSAAGDGSYHTSSCKLTHWQAIAWPGAARVEGSREVRQCPESADERKALGFDTAEASPARAPSRRRARRTKR
jgi:hypothetical protein